MSCLYEFAADKCNVKKSRNQDFSKESINYLNSYIRVKEKIFLVF